MSFSDFCKCFKLYFGVVCFNISKTYGGRFCVCMIAYISDNMRVGCIKFGDSITYCYVQL